MIPETEPAINPIITTAVNSGTSTVPITLCQTTASEVITPKVIKPCLMVSQKALGKKGILCNFIVK